MVFSSLFKKKAKDTENYFGIFLQTTKAIGFLYEMRGKSISVLAKESIPYTNSWEEIIDDMDRLISSLEEETKVHANKTIFFLYSTFIDEKTHEIKNPYKKTIKEIVKELDLEPLGYIECFEAVKEHMEHLHQGPFNGNIVEIDTTHTAAFVFKGGKNVFIRESARTQNIGDDISMIFSHKDSHLLLPSRLIVYGNINSEETRNQLQDYTWDEGSFVQLPRIEFFEDKELYDALGQTFLRQVIQEDPATFQELEDAQTEKTDQLEEKKEPENPKDDPGEKNLPKEPKEETGGTEVLGFVIGEDISEVEAVKKTHSPEQEQAEQSKEGLGFHIQEDAFEDSDNEKEKKGPFAFLANIKKPNLKMPDLSFAKPRRIPLGMIGAWLIVLLLIGGAGFAIEYFFHKVTVAVSFPAEVISEEFDYSIPVGEETNGITITEKVVTQDLSASKTATGTKEVGEQATGTVLLHNFDEEATTIAAGTTLSVDGLSYTLNEATTIPAAQEGTDTTGVVKQPGKAEASVTAAEIGTEYNIESGKRIAIGDLSSSVYFALSEGEFSGGSKEDVVIVAQADHTTLESQIEEQADKIDTSKIVEDIPEGQHLITDLTVKEIGTLEYSRPVGEEASEVSLKATVEIKTYTFDIEEMKTTLLEEMKPQTPDGYAIGTNTIEYDLSSVKIEEPDEDSLDPESEQKVVTMKVIADASAIKKMETDKIRKDITGKFANDVDFILKNRYDVEEYEIQNESQYLAVLNRWLPFFEKNIEIKATNTTESDEEENE